LPKCNERENPSAVVVALVMPILPARNQMTSDPAGSVAHSSQNHLPQEAPAHMFPERCKFCRKVVSVVEPEAPVAPTLSERIREPMEDSCHAWCGAGDGSGMSHAATANPANIRTANPRMSSVPFHERVPIRSYDLLSDRRIPEKNPRPQGFLQFSTDYALRRAFSRQ
jgi:hypothetical protein